jgi:glucokinase
MILEETLRRVTIQQGGVGTMSVIGIDLGGTKISGAVFDPGGAIAAREVVPLSSRSGGEVGLAILTLVRTLRSGPLRPEPVEAIGVAVPGISHAEFGTVWAPNIRGWEEYPLRDEIEREFPGRVSIDSDRACAILGESWKGNARGYRNAVFLAVGTGIGAGILVDGHLLRGAHDIGGAIGWLALQRPYRQEYASCGCFEHHASGSGLAKVARELIAEDPAYSGLLRRKRPAELTAEDVFQAEEAGDPVAGRTVREAVEFWGMACANIVSLFNPERIIFGGGVFGPALKFLPEIAREAARWAQPVSMTKVTFHGSALGPDAVLTGAGRLALGTLA